MASAQLRETTGASGTLTSCTVPAGHASQWGHIGAWLWRSTQYVGCGITESVQDMSASESGITTAMVVCMFWPGADFNNGVKMFGGTPGEMQVPPRSAVSDECPAWRVDPMDKVCAASPTWSALSRPPLPVECPPIATAGTCAATSPRSFGVGEATAVSGLRTDGASPSPSAPSPPSSSSPTTTSTTTTRPPQVVAAEARLTRKIIIKTKFSIVQSFPLALIRSVTNDLAESPTDYYINSGFSRSVNSLWDKILEVFIVDRQGIFTTLSLSNTAEDEEDFFTISTALEDRIYSAAEVSDPFALVPVLPVKIEITHSISVPGAYNRSLCSEDLLKLSELMRGSSGGGSSGRQRSLILMRRLDDGSPSGGTFQNGVGEVLTDPELPSVAAAKAALESTVKEETLAFDPGLEEDAIAQFTVPEVDTNSISRAVAEVQVEEAAADGEDNGTPPAAVALGEFQQNFANDLSTLNEYEESRVAAVSASTSSTHTTTGGSTTVIHHHQQDDGNGGGIGCCLCFLIILLVLVVIGLVVWIAMLHHKVGKHHEELYGDQSEGRRGRGTSSQKKDEDNSKSPPQVGEARKTEEAPPAPSLGSSTEPRPREPADETTEGGGGGKSIRTRCGHMPAAVA